MQAKWRFSDVYPVQKLSLSDIDNMVDASKEFTNVMDDRRLTNIMNMARSIREEAIANSVGWWWCCRNNWRTSCEFKEEKKTSYFS